MSVACNRAIEVFNADHWIWLEAQWYQLSKSHPNAQSASRYGPRALAHFYDADANVYDLAGTLPCRSHELYSSGGTLTVAAHLALRLGAKRIAFVACDAWSPARDRYHEWDPQPLNRQGWELHKKHLERTRQGIQDLVQAHPDVEFYDATQAERYLDLSRIDMKELASWGGVASGSTMPPKPVQILPHEILPRGYGRLVNTIPLGNEGCVLWFEDTAGTLRAVRMEYDLSNGLALRQRGQAVVCRS